VSAGRLETRLERLRALRDADAATRVAALRRALRDPSNYLAAKAAELAAACGDGALVPDLLEVYDAYFGEDAAQRDPQVWAKEAIARALRALGHRDPAAFVRGLHHVQLEPVWGKLVDAAPNLRCVCAQALVDTDLSTAAALRELLPHVVDAFAVVRVEVINAIAQIGGEEAALLLRLKALCGDPNAEVIGACFAAVVEHEPSAATAFIQPFLAAHAEDVAVEAAGALVLSRDPDALDAVRAFLHSELSRDAREAVVTVCAGSPQPAVTELLLEIVAGTDAGLAERAVRALAQSRFRQQARERARAAVERSRNVTLRTVYADVFEPDA